MRFSSLLSLALTGLATASLQIVPGGSWTSTQGAHLQAHGGAILKSSSLYYLIGENKLGGYAYQSIRCYSSPDLHTWTFANSLLVLEDSGDLGPSRIVERPKVLYNEKTDTWVMYMHIDSSNYGDAKVGVATRQGGAGVCGGEYTYQGSFRPLGYESRDMGLFKDDDGAGYLLTEDRVNGLRINRLSDDYLNVTSNVYTWAEKYESPAVIKKDGVYFMFASQLTGWNPNDNFYSTATSLSGPWSAWAKFAGEGTNTHDSQVTAVFPISSSSALYMGDRWKSDNLLSSTYIWLPLELNGTTANLPWEYNFPLEVGEEDAFPAVPADNAYEAEASGNTLSGGAVSVSCSGCSGGTAVGNIGGPSGGQLVFKGVVSNVAGWTTVRMRYTNGDLTERFANVVVNGGKAVRVAFIPSDNGQATQVASVNVELKAGENEIAVLGVDGGWGPDVDRILVPVE